MFNPSRLEIARKRRLMTKIRLAEASGISTRSLYTYEKGEDTPTLETQKALARALTFPLEFFYGPDVEVLDSAGVSFRSLATMTAGQREAALAAGSIALELSRWIDERFGLPAPNVPDLRQFTPEEAAVALRTHWGLGESSVRSMVHLLEANGVRVFSLAEKGDEVDAFSFWKAGTPFVFLNTVKSAEHGRFDAAHELGHLVLHGHGEPNGREAEQQANAFAAAFLMPSGSVKAHVPATPSLETLIRLKALWNVSVIALTRRLHDLKHITDWHYRMLSEELGMRGFRRKEPNGTSRETSQVLQKVFAALKNEGVTKADVARALCITSTDLDELIFGLVMTQVRGEGVTSFRATVRRTNRQVDLKLVPQPRRQFAD
jgi:Zn-dependent peptidase ImmA (M78 family)/DNA-binding XRE family transcriptional regulator